MERGCRGTSIYFDDNDLASIWGQHHVLLSETRYTIVDGQP